MDLSASTLRLLGSGTLAFAAILGILHTARPAREDAVRRAAVRAAVSSALPGAPALPETVERALAGFGTAAGVDDTRLREALVNWMTADPESACRFVFRELPVEYALKFLPDLMAALSAESNERVAACLKGVRTQKELTEAWRLVIEGRMAREGSDALDLALRAPAGAGIAESYLSGVLKGRDAAGIGDLLKRGLPVEWLLPSSALHREGKLAEVSSLEIYRALDAHFAGNWSKINLVRFLSVLTPSKGHVKPTVAGGCSDCTP